MSVTPNYEHQDLAVDALWSELQTKDRGTVVSACGTGKTRKQSKLLKRHLDDGARTLVVFAPTIDLVYQNAKSYAEQLGDEVEIIAISSDSLRGKQDAISTLDTPEAIHEAMSKDGKPVLFVSTYDSGHKIGKAQRLGDNIIPIDGGVFDEAHTAAGEKDLDAQTAIGLDDEKILIRKRSFFTATPRAAKNTLKASSAISMTDQSLFGRVVYNFPYSKAREAGIVSDYSIFVPIVTKAEVKDLMERRGLDEKATQNLMAEIAALKVMEETGQTRFISYHNSVSGSKAFSKAMGKALEGRDFHIAHVDGKTPPAERDAHITTLREGERYVVSNANIFREGTDAQRLQGAIIVDASSSQERIIQTISRPMRTDPSDPGKVASIVVPLLVEDASRDSILAAARSSAFATVIEVAEAMRHTDNLFDQDVRQRSYEIGAGIEERATPQAGQKFKVLGADLSETDKEQLTEAVNVVAIDKLRDSFSHSLGQYHAFIEKHHDQPRKVDDPALFLWAEQQRRLFREGKLDPEHARLLDETKGWSWLPEKSQVKTVTATLDAFMARHGRSPRYLPGEEDVLRFGNMHAETLLAMRLDMAERYGLETQNSDPTLARSPQAKLYFELKENGFPLYEDRGRAGPSRPKKSVLGSLHIARGTSRRDQIVFTPLSKGAEKLALGDSKLITELDARVMLEIDDPEVHRQHLELAKGPNMVSLSFGDTGEPVRRPKMRRTTHVRNPALDVKAQGLNEVLRQSKGPELAADKAAIWDLAPSQQNRIRDSLTPAKYVRPVDGFDTAARDRAFPVMEVRTLDRPGSRMLNVAPGANNRETLNRKQPHPDYFVPVLLEEHGQTSAMITKVLDKSPRRFTSHLPGSPAHLAVALHDWSLSGPGDPCSHVSIARGKIDPSAQVPCLGPDEPMTVREMRNMIETVQDAHVAGTLSSRDTALLEAAPGFSFVETARLPGLFAKTTKAIASRHGETILADPKARDGDTGLANTLKVIDHVVANAHAFPQADQDLKELAADRLLVPIQAVNRKRRAPMPREALSAQSQKGQYPRNAAR